MLALLTVILESGSVGAWAGGNRVSALDKTDRRLFCFSGGTAVETVVSFVSRREGYGI